MIDYYKDYSRKELQESKERFEKDLKLHYSKVRPWRRLSQNNVELINNALKIINDRLYRNETKPENKKWKGAKYPNKGI